MLGKAIALKAVVATGATACVSGAALCLNPFYPPRPSPGPPKPPVTVAPPAPPRPPAPPGRGHHRGHHHPSPPTTTPPTTSPPAADEQDIEVTVPPVPPRAALPGLCRAFLASDSRGQSGAEFQILVGATGGTTSKTGAWCRQYLLLYARGEATGPSAA